MTLYKQGFFPIYYEIVKRKHVKLDSKHTETSI